MALLQEKQIRAYHLKADTFVCPVCATDEEKETTGPEKIIAEDVIHNEESMFCARCKKKIK